MYACTCACGRPRRHAADQPDIPLDDYSAGRDCVRPALRAAGPAACVPACTIRTRACCASAFRCTASCKVLADPEPKDQSSLRCACASITNVCNAYYFRAASATACGMNPPHAASKQYNNADKWLLQHTYVYECRL